MCELASGRDLVASNALDAAFADGFPAEYVNRCGHAQEFVVLPDGEHWCRLMPVLGEAR
jgi:hypothetical protein